MSFVKSKKIGKEELVKELDADADKIVSEAGITDDMVGMKKLVTKANSFKQFVKEKRKQNSWTWGYYWEDGDGIAFTQ